jgi:delta 1-pyrroline-5-carboxylate dehydrogenase
MASEAKAAVKKYRMFIGGEFTEGARGAYFPVVDPSTEEIIAEVPDADEKDVHRAVAAAKAAWPSASAKNQQNWPSWNHGTAASLSSKPSTISPTSRPASNTMAVWRQKFSAT